MLIDTTGDVMDVAAAIIAAAATIKTDKSKYNATVLRWVGDVGKLVIACGMAIERGQITTIEITKDRIVVKIDKTIFKEIRITGLW